MCGVIVVDAGRSRSTNLGRDAYIMSLPGYRHNYLKFYQFPTVICLPTVCYFSREKPLVKPTAPGLVLLLFAFAIYFIFLLFPDLLNQKYLAAIYFSWHSTYQSITTFSHSRANFWRRYPKGIDNPFYTSGCEYLLFVCKCCLRCVAWFS